jgi:hypothetical protein
MSVEGDFRIGLAEGGIRIAQGFQYWSGLHDAQESMIDVSRTDPARLFNLGGLDGARQCCRGGKRNECPAHPHPSVVKWIWGAMWGTRQ